MRKIKDVKDALGLFEEAAIKQGEAIDEGNSKAANRNYDKIAEVAKFLRANKCIKELSVFYEHSNVSVRLFAAAYLLPVDEKRSLEVLYEISQMRGIESHNAKMTIQEWKNGNLRNYYTL